MAIRNKEHIVGLITKFMALRFMPEDKEPDEPYNFKPDGHGKYIVERTWEQHLMESYKEDADALVEYLSTQGVDIIS